MLKVQAPADEKNNHEENNYGHVRGEQRIPMSYEAFLAIDGEHQHAEWEDGTTIIFMPATPQHQDIVTFLVTLLRLFTDFFQLGTVLTAPVEMKVSPTSNAREPDILFVAKANLDLITAKRLTGPADLVIEVISPESVARDHRQKFREYQEAGVKEYWVIDPRPGLQPASFWVLDHHGRYQAGIIDEEGIYHSTVLPGFWLDVAWLQISDLPNPLFTFAQLTNLPPAIVQALHQIAARGPIQK